MILLRAHLCSLSLFVVLCSRSCCRCCWKEQPCLLSIKVNICSSEKVGAVLCCFQTFSAPCPGQSCGFVLCPWSRCCPRPSFGISWSVRVEAVPGFAVPRHSQQLLLFLFPGLGSGIRQVIMVGEGLALWPVAAVFLSESRRVPGVKDWS